MFENEQYPMLWEVFERTILDSATGRVIVVVDALDECAQESSDPFLRSIKTSFNANHAETFREKFKLVITSRHYPQTLIERLSDVACIEVSLDDNPESLHDVERFIATNVDGLSLRKGLSEGLRLQVEKELQKGAEATFLWAGLMMKQLETKQRIEMAATLRKLPSGLDSLYERLLLQIQDANKPDAVAVVEYVSFVHARLSFSELGYLIGQEDVAGLTLDEAIADKIKFCEGLIEYDQNYIYPVHSSLRDYLANCNTTQTPFFRMLGATTHRKLVDICLSHIEEAMESEYMVQTYSKFVALSNESDHAARLQKHDHEVMVSALKDNFPFLAYAERCWAYHGILSGQDVYDLQRPLFNTDDRLRTRLSFYRYFPNTAGKFSEASFGRFTPFDQGCQVKTALPLIHFALRWGALPLVEKALARGQDVTAQDSDGETIIHTFFYVCPVVGDGFAKPGLWTTSDQLQRPGCYWDPEPILETILGQTLPPDTILGEQDLHGETPLHKAILRGYPHVIKLIEKLSDSQTILGKQGGRQRTPLHCLLNRIMYIRLSWARTPDESQLWQSQHLPLLRAILGRMSVIDLSNKTDAHGMTVLFYSIRYATDEVVKLLLEYGAHPNVRVERPLWSESRVDFFYNVSIPWLELVAWDLCPTEMTDVGTKLISVWVSCLEEAALRGDISKVKLLLKYEASIVPAFDDYPSALHYAAMTGRRNVAKCLLDLSTTEEVSSSVEDFGSPLTQAIFHSHYTIAKLLLDKTTAESITTSHRGQNILHRAARAGQGWLVSLIASKIPTDRLSDLDNEGFSALELAIKSGDGESTRALYEAMPTTERHCMVFDYLHRTPLHCAAEMENLETISFLCEQDELLNILLRDGNGQTPLHRAAECGRVKTTEMLLDYMIDDEIQIKDTSGNTAAALAEDMGYRGIADLISAALNDPLRHQ